MIIDLPKPVAVVCHDAGATNLILPWIEHDNPAPLLPVMGGPAAALWAQRFGESSPFSLEQAIDDAAAVLSGTGWASDLEHRARRMAREKGIRSVAVIDHWVNYRMRFDRDGELVLPDEIWVTDPYALDLAREAFGDVPVRQMPNLYLEEQVAKAPPCGARDQDVLYVAEPARSDWGRGTPGEFQALDYFMAHRKEADIPDEAPIRLRPHPSDPPGKYDQWAAGQGNISIDRSPDLGTALGGARWVVGCQSYALVVALEAGRHVISALPPWAPRCVLPHSGIVHLSELAPWINRT